MNTVIRKSARVGLVALVAVAITACAFQRAQEASDARAAMVGMPKEQVLACMGPPASSAAVGGTEVWTYNSGNGRTDTFGTASAFGGPTSATAIGSNTTTSRFCKVDVVMARGRVSRINYSGPTGGLITAGEQCAFAIDNCMQQQQQVPMRTAVQVVPLAPPDAAQPVAMSVAVEAQTYTPPPTCSKEDRETARLAREAGYRYSSVCN
jgi:hypothetical protein